LPSMIAAERSETYEPTVHGIVDVLLRAAHAGGRRIRLDQTPPIRRGLVGPHLGVLLTPAALVVSAPAQHTLRHRIVRQRRLVAHTRRLRPILDGTALEPCVRLLWQRFRSLECDEDERERQEHEKGATHRWGLRR